MALSKNAKNLLQQRYCRAGEQPKDVYKRVASALSLGDTKFEKKLRIAMSEGYFLPNSPCLRNAGTKKGMLHACGTGDTIIHTLEGEFTIKYLSEKYRKGEKFKVYSCDNGKIKIGDAFSPRLTRKNADVFEVSFKISKTRFGNGLGYYKSNTNVIKNGLGKIKLTGDHLIMLRDGSYRRVDELNINDSIMPFNHYFRQNRLMIYDKIDEGFTKASGFVYKNIFGEVDSTIDDIHHKNGNSLDDRPKNLEKINHFKHRSNHMKINNPMFDKESCEKISKLMINNERALGKRWKQKKTLEKEYSSHNHSVISVKYIGKEDVYDLSVEKYHNFAANGIFIHNCFVLPVEDTMESISDALRDMIIIFKNGGGVGINFSKLRPKDAMLGTGGTSSGVVSFMKLFDTATEVVKQGGFRRGALMGVLNFEHAEVMEFIQSKLKGDLTNFNISVMVSDKFMKDVEVNNKIELKNPQDNSTYNILNAKTIFDIICNCAWMSGDPGFLFYDRINKDNKLFPKLKIKATNPCVTGDTLVQTVEGEIPIKKLVGKEIDVYTMDSSGKLCIRKAYNIVKTKRVIKLIKINTGRGELTCTPEHEIYTRNRGMIAARYLTKNDKIVGLNRRMRNENYCSVGLTNSDNVSESRFIASHYYDIKGKNVHHKDENTLNNVKSNLEVLEHGEHSRVSNLGHENYHIGRDSKGKFLKGKTNRPKKPNRSTGRKTGINWRVSSVTFVNKEEDVYDLTVEYTHNFIANGIVISNCGEVPLPPYGACCLGSINISKLVKYNKFDFDLFAKYLEIAVRALRNNNAISHYPLNEITKIMKELDPIGVGIMGFADCLIKLSIKYDSQECLDLIDQIGLVYKEVTDKLAKGCFWKRIIAPTGSLSILADCSSGIEPIFDIDFERHLTVGVIRETRELYKSKYARTAHDILPEWHLKVQAKWQEWLDGSISKTINLPNNASVEDVKHIYMEAWRMGCKGITIFRDGSKGGVLKRKSPPKQKCSDENCHL